MDIHLAALFGFVAGGAVGMIICRCHCQMKSALTESNDLGNVKSGYQPNPMRAIRPAPPCKPPRPPKSE